MKNNVIYILIFFQYITGFSAKLKNGTTILRKPATLLLFFVMPLIFTSCITLYKPNPVHSPLLKEKGEFSTSASLGLSGCGLYNLQAAYAPSNHTGIMIDGMYHKRNMHGGDSSVEKLNILFGEAGAGYFTTFGNKKNGLFQCYGGGGYGLSSDKIYNTRQSPPEMKARYFNLFIQPGIALVNKNFSLAFDLRANYVNIFTIHASLYDKFEWWNTDFHYYSDTSLYFTNLEPAITMRSGGKKLKGIIQFGATIPTINPHSYFMANTSSLLGVPLLKFSVGINYTFGKNQLKQNFNE